MKHTGYNSDAFMYAKDGSLLRIRPVPPLFITSYDYKYNGQEYQDELGLNVTAMDFRQYDMALGRFNSIDELAEFYHDQTPYVFSLNLPTLFGDPTGLCPECAKNVPNPTNGASYVVNGINYIFNGTDWEGQVEEVVVKINNKKTESKETSTVDDINNTAKGINDWVDKKIGKPLRDFFQPASDWATDYSKAHTSIGAGDIWRKHVEPAKIIYESGLGMSGFSISNTRSFAVKSSLKIFKSTMKVMEEGYEAYGEVIATINNRELLKILNKASKGGWEKVYEAGILNGEKLEIHYFRNIKNGKVFDVKVKYNYWHQKSFKKIKP